MKIQFLWARSVNIFSSFREYYLFECSRSGRTCSRCWLCSFFFYRSINHILEFKSFHLFFISSKMIFWCKACAFWCSVAAPNFCRFFFRLSSFLFSSLLLVADLDVTINGSAHMTIGQTINNERQTSRKCFNLWI